MSFFVLVSVASGPSGPSRPAPDSREFWLESWDGSQVLPIGGYHHEGALQLQTGNAGLEEAPTDVFVDRLAQASGGVVVDAQSPPRPILLPLQVNTRDQAEQLREVQALRDLTDPTVDMTRDGNFRLVCRSASGTRQLGLVRRSGMEGTGGLLPWSARYVLDCVAPQPFAEDRDVQTRPFQLEQPDTPFLGGVWGQIGLVSSRIAGPDTPVVMTSAVPVYPTITVTGPASSVLITGDNGLRLDVPDGLEALEVLTWVTDPRHRSVRVNGALAAGRLARGSRPAPFGLGTTTLSVSAPDATGDTRLVISWRGLHRSLW